MAQAMTERERRKIRRDQIRDLSNRNQQDELENEMLESIRERDRDIQDEQLRQIHKQRSHLEQQRKQAKKEREALKQIKELDIGKYDKDNDLEKLRERSNELELEVQRLQSMPLSLEMNVEDKGVVVRKLTYDNVDDDGVNIEETGACGNDYSLRNRTDGQTPDDCSIGELDKEHHKFERPYWTLDRYGDCHDFSTVNSGNESDNQTHEIDSEDDNRSDGEVRRDLTYDKKNTVDRELSWLDTKYRNMDKVVHSEDRIKIEGGKSKRYIKKEHSTDSEDESENALIKQIESLKLKELEMIEGIKRKERLRDAYKHKEEQGKMKNARRKLKEYKLKKLMEEKQALEQSLLEKGSTLSTLDDDLERASQTEKKVKSRKGTDKRQESPAPLMCKPNVPVLSDVKNFVDWKKEVQSMLESKVYHPELLRQSVRNAIKDSPRKVLATMKSNASVKEILDTLENNFGDIKSGESILEEFYTTKQENGEDSVAWGVRLEVIMQRAIQKGQIETSKRDDALKTRFWKHLRDKDLRNATRVYYDTAKTFEELKKKVRSEEEEMDVPKETERSTQINTQQIDAQTKLLNELKAQTTSTGGTY